MNKSCCPTSSTTKWYHNKIVLVVGVLFLMIGISYRIEFLVPFREALVMYGKRIWWAVLLGLMIGGMVDYFIPQKHVSYILARKKKRTVFAAVGLGFLMSACCHGILAIAIELYKKGASTPAVIAFLLASPWANLPLTFMLIGFFGLIQALYLVLSAVIIAIISGLIFQILENRHLIETNKNVTTFEDGFSMIEDVKKRMQGYHFSAQQLRKDVKGIWQGALNLSNMVLWWILIGTGLAALAGAYIPQDIFQNYMGPTAGGMFITLLVATVLEVCSEGTAPMAFELFRQTGALGNSLVFLMAGVATDYTEIGLLWHNIGRRTAIWLPIVAVPQIILFGILANMIFSI